MGDRLGKTIDPQVTDAHYHCKAVGNNPASTGMGC
jgi:hypothetical protein